MPALEFAQARLERAQVLLAVAQIGLQRTQVLFERELPGLE
jgi:hypothetical protein